MFPSFRVLRVAGIDIEINISWLIILGLLTATLSEQVFPNQYEGWGTATYWIIGLTAALLLFVTVLVHELAHAIVANRRGLPVGKITLFVFGGVSHMSRQPRDPREEFLIAGAGPATSVVIAIICGALATAAAGLNEQALAIFAYLSVVNLLLAVFNMLPGFPLDGGRVLRSIAWRKTGSHTRATNIAGNVGQVFGYGIAALGFFWLLGGAIITGVWFILIGLFLNTAARGEAQSVELNSTLRGRDARDVMRPTFPSIAPDATLQDLVDRYVLGEGQRAVMIGSDGTVDGIVTVTDLGKVSRDRWATVPAREVMTPRNELVTAAAGDPAVDVLEKVASDGLNQVPVFDGERMIGMISRRELIERVELQRSFGNTNGDDPEQVTG